jgi:dUTP pyrophosphatase
VRNGPPDHWHYHQVSIEAVRMTSDADWPLPAARKGRWTGYDVAACIDVPVRIAPGERAIIPTGWAFHLPDGFELQIRPDFDCAVQKTLTLACSPCTVDSVFTGEILLPVLNFGRLQQRIDRGDVLARIAVVRTLDAQFELRDGFAMEEGLPRPCIAGDGPSPTESPESPDTPKSLPTRHDILDFLSENEGGKATRTDIYNRFKGKIGKNLVAFNAALLGMIEDGLISYAIKKAVGRGRRKTFFWLECKWPPEKRPPWKEAGDGETPSGEV